MSFIVVTTLDGYVIVGTGKGTMTGIEATVFEDMEVEPSTSMSTKEVPKGTHSVEVPVLDSEPMPITSMDRFSPVSQVKYHMEVVYLDNVYSTGKHHIATGYSAGTRTWFWSLLGRAPRPTIAQE